MAVHRGRVVEVGGGEDEGHRLRVQGRAPALEARARLLGEPGGVEGESLPEPVVAGGEPALRVLPDPPGAELLPGPGDLRLVPRVLRGLEEGGQGRLELGSGIGRPVLGMEERRSVGLAVPAPDRVVPVVEEHEPGPVVGQVPCPGPGHELVQVGVSPGPGRREDAGQGQEDRGDRVAGHDTKKHTAAPGDGVLETDLRRVRDQSVQLAARTWSPRTTFWTEATTSPALTWVLGKIVS